MGSLSMVKYEHDGSVLSIKSSHNPITAVPARKSYAKRYVSFRFFQDILLSKPKFSLRTHFRFPVPGVGLIYRQQFPETTTNCCTSRLEMMKKTYRTTSIFGFITFVCPDEVIG